MLCYLVAVNMNSGFDALVGVVQIGRAVLAGQDDGLAVGEVPFASLQSAGGLSIEGIVTGSNREAGGASVPGVGLAIGQANRNGAAGCIADFHQGSAAALGEGAAHRQHGEQDHENDRND